MNIMENATKHFEDQVKSGLNEVDVPEWGCKVYYLPVMTVKEMEALYSHMEKGNQLDALVEMLILRARNEDGSMAFKKGDKFEIMNIVKKIKKISFIEAEKVWYKATLDMDDEIYLIMKKMILEEDVGILLNRNPTISYGSILYLRVAGIKHNYDDLTMSLHNGILSLLAGDYDGDVLNVVSVKDQEMKDVFREVFSPISLIIDSNNGKFNSALNLERDQVLGLNSLLI